MGVGGDMSHLFQSSRDREWADMKDDAAYESNDGRSDTRTTFYFTGGEWKNVSPAKREYYQWLATLNDGYGESSRKMKTHRADCKRLIDVYSGQFEFSVYQKDRIQFIVDHISLHFGPYRYEETILALCTVVADESMRDLQHEDMYYSFIESIETDLKSIRRLRSLVRDRMIENEHIAVDFEK